MFSSRSIVLSRRPTEKAYPMLVVASASKPRWANSLAVPASQGLGMMNAPLRSWSARKMRPFSACVGMETADRPPASTVGKPAAGSQELGKLFGERLDRLAFVVLDVEDGVELGDLEQVVNFLGEVEQLELAALVANGSERADQLADSGAVDVGHVAEVEQDFLLAFGNQVFHRFTQDHAAFAQGDATAHIDDGNAVYLSRASLHCHCVSSLAFAVLRPTCLISVISVPGCTFLNLTSSMKARIRKMPLPEPFIRFSGARGSGIKQGSKPLPWSVIVMTRASLVVS